MGELPSPASFENTPRLIPAEIVLDMVYPDIPPMHLSIPNASSNILKKTPVSCERVLYRTMIHMEVYSIVANGRNI